MHQHSETSNSQSWNFKHGETYLEHRVRSFSNRVLLPFFHIVNQMSDTVNMMFVIVIIQHGEPLNIATQHLSCFYEPG